jgi:hypothetical protein
MQNGSGSKAPQAFQRVFGGVFVDNLCKMATGKASSRQKMMNAIW